MKQAEVSDAQIVDKKPKTMAGPGPGPKTTAADDDDDIPLSSRLNSTPEGKKADEADVEVETAEDAKDGKSVECLQN